MAPGYPGMSLVSLGKNPLLIQELKSGRLEAVIFESVQAQAFIQANPSLKQIALKNTSNECRIAFSKKKSKYPQLKEQFNSALVQLKKRVFLTNFNPSG